MHGQEVKPVNQPPHLIDKKLLFHSKVARNIFFLFILCALIPLCVLAYYAFNQVTGNLYSQAQEQLRQTSKASGMSIIERLQFLEAELDVISNSLQTGDEKMLAYSLHIHNYRHMAEFDNLVLITASGVAKTILGNMTVPPTLSNDEQQYLLSGEVLVITRPDAGSRTSVFMVKALGQPPASHDLLFCEIRPEYLWGEGFLSQMTELMVLDQSNNILFSSFPEYLPLDEVKSAIGENPSTGRFTWRYRNDSYEANYWTIFMRPQFNTNWLLVQSQSSTDILAPVSHFKRFFLLSVLLTFFIVLLLSLRQIRRSLIPIELLREATKKIAAKDFNSRVTISTNDEFEELGVSFNEMAMNLENHLQTMGTLNQIGIALSEEKSNDRLLELILTAAKNMTNADGCALYTLTGDKQLRLSVMNIDSIHLVMNRDGNMVVPLFDDDGKLNTLTAIAFSALKDAATVNIPDIYHATSFDFSHNHDFDRTIGYRSQSLLSVPVKNHENEIVGVLQLINAQERTSRTVVPFSDEDQRLLETLASQAAVALSKNKLIDDFRKLFDSLVELIATAIDEKSPYTGDHCRRVPELTMMLAEAVAGKKEGVFKDFNLSEEEMYELKVSALLHDCGKVTTPVHIVDKATRLETIFDGIHLIDGHFEILRRDAQIAFLQKQISLFPLISGNKSSAEEYGIQIKLARKELEKTLKQIDRDQKLVRVCNIGETEMNDDLIQRIKNIALKYRWINAESREELCISEREMYMLTSSAKGTLTPDERAVINQHIKTTIKMLGSLHYPKSLRNVPIFAQAHHEHMDGTGYPMGLTREQIPLQGRMIAIADIFESLTAKDRPYRKGLTLIEALRMLCSMKQNGHIDPDLFDLFIEEKVYLRYAEKYLSQTEIDENVLCEMPKNVSPPSRQPSPDRFNLNRSMPPTSDFIG